jgi:hypothetical protein
LPLKLLLLLALVGLLLTGGIWYYFTPKYTRVGYMPNQPVSYSHEIHVNQLGMDCRYCHSNIEVSGHANVPTTQTCMNCHLHVQKENPKLELVRRSYETGRPMEWVRIHETPDYAYFNHAVHVRRGISCVSCHGKVNRMEIVWHHEPQSMGWCLECHRQPEEHLRPVEQVYNLDWEPEEGVSPGEIGLRLKEDWQINPPENCAACHR